MIGLVMTTTMCTSLIIYYLNVIGKALATWVGKALATWVGKALATWVGKVSSVLTITVVHE